MKIAIGSDHAGFLYKGMLIEHLKSKGHSVSDFGTDSEDPCDYPVFVRPVAEAVANEEADRGIALGGSGNGEAMVANRLKGVRCAVCWNVDSAVLARRHNDANMVAIGQRMMPWAVAIQIVDAFLTEPFDGGRHERRVGMIDR
jgi:ribose 5-phosphate isomerase B